MKSSTPSTTTTRRRRARGSSSSTQSTTSNNAQVTTTTATTPTPTTPPQTTTTTTTTTSNAKPTTTTAPSSSSTTTTVDSNSQQQQQQAPQPIQQFSATTNSPIAQSPMVTYPLMPFSVSFFQSLLTNSNPAFLSQQVKLPQQFALNGTGQLGHESSAVVGQSVDNRMHVPSSTNFSLFSQNQSVLSPSSLSGPFNMYRLPNGNSQPSTPNGLNLTHKFMISPSKSTSKPAFTVISDSNDVRVDNDVDMEKANEEDQTTDVDLVAESDPAMYAMARTLLGMMIKEQLQPELVSFVKSATNSICTVNALDYHRRRYKERRDAIKKRSGQNIHSVIKEDPDVTDESDHEDKFEHHIDALRRSIVREWKVIRSDYEWRWDWLQLRIQQLEQELSVSSAELDDIREWKTDFLDALKNASEQGYLASSRMAGFDWKQPELVPKYVKGVAFEQYPPQKRRADINSHPLFSPAIDKKLIKRRKKAPTKDEIEKSNLLYSQSLFITPPKPKNVLNDFSVIQSIPQQQTEVPAMSNNRTVSKKRKYPGKAPETPSSRRKLSRATRRSDSKADIDDVVIPWDDLRSNFKIPELKTKEIFTPQWRTVDDDVYQSYFDQKAKEAAVQNAPMETSDDDTSDETYCVMHLPRELLERKRFFSNSKPTTNRKKKRREEEEDSIPLPESKSISTTPKVPDKIIKEIHSVFEEEQNRKKDQPDPTATPAKVSPETTAPPAPAFSVAVVQTRKTKKETLKDVLATRWKHIDPKTYIPDASPYLGEVRGNFEEMKVKDREYREKMEAERKIREEQQKTQPRAPRSYYSNDVYYNLDDVVGHSDEDFTPLAQQRSRRTAQHNFYSLDEDAEDLSFLDDDEEYNERFEEANFEDDDEFVLGYHKRKSTPSSEKKRKSKRGGRKKGPRSLPPPAEQALPPLPPLEGIWQCASVIGNKILLRRVDSA